MKNLVYKQIMGDRGFRILDASEIPPGTRWITLENGEHVLINGQTGKVVSGAGGNLNGKYYASEKTVPFEKKKPVELPPGEYGGNKTYTVNKVGRKYLHVTETGKSYTMQMEKNHFSVGAQPGDTVEGHVNIHRENNIYGTKTTIYPLSEEQIPEAKKAKNKPEIHRQLGFVEAKAKEGYIYENGVQKLTNLGIHEHPEEMERLIKAIESVNELKRQKEAFKAERRQEEKEKGVTFLHVPYSEKDRLKKHGIRWNPERRQWYVVGEVPKELEQYIHKASYGRISKSSSGGMPQYGRISENDPSIYGSELLGWEGHTWQEFHRFKQMGMTHFTSGEILPPDY